MRVIAGSAKGRRIDAPGGSATRPTSDRVREAVFNALGSLGVVDGAEVLDLFAGTGAMGVEALSRGAAHVTFVEQSRRTAEVITSNLARTDLSGAATLVVSDVEAFLKASSHSFDLVFVDPPYVFDGWLDLEDQIDRVAPGGVVVMESDRVPEIIDRWSVVRERRYGSTLVTIAEVPTDPRERR